jgi:hypothetical protein
MLQLLMSPVSCQLMLQVYSKDELSPLPFQPPAFFTYATTMLSGAFKVFQYVITIMVRCCFAHQS